MMQIPNFVKWVWKTPIWRINPSEKAIYLSFDDGPNPKVTPEVLKILDEFEAKATFFCVGENVSKYPELFHEIKNRGHAVGNHTYNHLKGFENSTADYVANVLKADTYIKSYLFRPPHGRIKPKQVNALKKDFKIIMWDFITYDYDRNVSPEQILEIVKKQSRNGSVVVFHDSEKAEKNVLSVLPEVLKFWKNEAYELKLVI